QAETRYGCFLPDLTGLARDLSIASLPRGLYQDRRVMPQAGAALEKSTDSKGKPSASWVLYTDGRRAWSEPDRPPLEGVPMTVTHQMTAILPCNDLDASEAFYARLGFSCAARHADYRILADGKGGALHLASAVEGWLVPGRNPFGLYLYSGEQTATRPHINATEFFCGSGHCPHAPRYI